MCEKQFIKTYCNNCGTQRCEGPGTEWFEECSKRWNLDGYGDAAAEIERLNNKIMELGYKLVKLQTHGEWIKGGGSYYCSVCGSGVLYDYTSPYSSDVDEELTPYCPHCGTKMDGGRE